MADHTEEQVVALADAMWQLLDDMGKGGKSCCLAAKAYARVAYEPFRDKAEPEYDDWMSFADVKTMVDDIEGSQ